MPASKTEKGVTVQQLQKQLTRKRDELNRIITKARARLAPQIDELVEKLQGSCDHSKTENYQWEHDNGYGRQSMMVGKRCVYCGWKNHWGNMGSFQPPSHFRD